MATKVSSATLASLGAEVQVPTYDRTKIVPRMVHVGVGGFYRAHQALYTDDLLAGDSDWGYCGVGLLKHDARMRDTMRDQDCLYTLVERSQSGDSARVIGSIGEFLFAPDGPEVVLEKMASADTKLISLTITEGGYYIHQGTGKFDEHHPDIQRDLANPHQPGCSFGYLLEAMDRRRTRGVAPCTLMSCDNIQSNGDMLKTMLLAFAELRDPALRRWIETNVAFPNSMVDRITPATTDEHRALVRDHFGIDDEWPVTTESFKQWVIEDHFSQGRPAWEQVGAQMTHNVLPYEKMKLRLLNASHQAICYSGMLLGLTFAHEAMDEPLIRGLMEGMMDVEVTPLLTQPEGIDLTEYKATLVERFANPAIRDQLARIGTEGSARIAKFVLPSVAEQLQRSGSVDRLAYTVAGWFRYLSGHGEKGETMPINDPMEAKLRERAQVGGKDPAALLGMREVFSAEVAEHPVFRAKVGEWLRSLYDEGTAATLQKVAALPK